MLLLGSGASAVWSYSSARWLWIGRFSSFLGDQILEIAIIAVVWELTRSSWVTGVVIFAGRVPFWLLVWIGGVCADRWSTRAPIVVTSLLSGILAGSVLVVYRTGALEAWQVGCVAFGISALRTIEAPVLSAQLPLLVPPRYLMAINGLLDNTKRVARLIAPVLIAMCHDLLSLGQLFGLVALTYWCMAAAAWLMTDAEHPAALKNASKPSLGSWKDTWSEVRRDRELFCAIVFSGAYTVAHGACYWVLVPRLLLDELGLGTAGLALVVAGFGAGGLIGNVLLLASGYSGHRSLVAIGMALASTAFLCFAFVPGQAAAIGAAILGGLALPMMDISVQTLIHERAGAKYWGRVFALWRYIAEIGIGIGLLIGGPIAETVGCIPGLVGLGLYGVVVGMTLLVFRPVMHAR